MKNLLVIVLPLFLFSCKSGVESHKAAIESLDSSWTATTEAVTNFAGSLTADVNSYTEAASGLAMTEAQVATLKPDASAKWNEAMTAYKAATNDAYAPLQAELNDFITMWTEKSASVTALNEGLAAGKIEGDVAAQVAELNGLVTQGQEKLATWTAKQGEIKTAADSALGMLKSANETATAK